MSERHRRLVLFGTLGAALFLLGIELGKRFAQPVESPVAVPAMPAVPSMPAAPAVPTVPAMPVAPAPVTKP